MQNKNVDTRGGENVKWQQITRIETQIRSLERKAIGNFTLTWQWNTKGEIDNKLQCVSNKDKGWRTH